MLCFYINLTSIKKIYFFISRKKILSSFDLVACKIFSVFVHTDASISVKVVWYEKIIFNQVKKRSPEPHFSLLTGLSVMR